MKDSGYTSSCCCEEQSFEDGWKRWDGKEMKVKAESLVESKLEPIEMVLLLVCFLAISSSRPE